jgi:hypothetical protein
MEWNGHPEHNKSKGRNQFIPKPKMILKAEEANESKGGIKG